MFWIIGAALSALTMLALLVPVVAKRNTREFRGRAQAVYADQLAEVGRDENLGLISAAEADSARTEVKRRMLSNARRQSHQTKPGARRQSWVLIVAAALVPVFGIGMYLDLGSPQIPSLPYADRAAERASAAKLRNVLADLRARLVAMPDSPAEGWVLLAQGYMRISRPDEAVWAYGKLLKRGDADLHPEIYVSYAEAMISSDNGIVTPKAEAALEKALARQPDNVAALYYKSIALEQAGELKTAFTILRDRIAQETTARPWTGSLVARANFLAARIGATPLVAPPAAAGPSNADIAAASQMSKEDRQAFVRSMVARLAARLEKQPDDLDGWLQLARAYSVLGEGGKALAAFRKADTLTGDLPADDRRRALIQSGLKGKPLSD